MREVSRESESEKAKARERYRKLPRKGKREVGKGRRGKFDKK